MSRYFPSLFAAILLLFPAFAFAAFNDVTLTTDTVITAGGVSMNVSSSNATIESITVGASSFDVVLQSGSSIKVEVPSKRALSHNALASLVAENTCNSTASALAFSATGTSATITITPLSTTCGVSDSSSSTSAGSGGLAAASGGIVGLFGKVNQQQDSQLLTTPGGQSPQGTQGSVVFTKTLRLGASGDEVRKLQEFLARDKDIYPEGRVTGYFGALTREAVQRFQTKYGIVSQGTEQTAGYGLVGPKTRAKIAEVSGSVESSFPAPAGVSPVSPPPQLVEPQATATLQAKLDLLKIELATLIERLKQAQVAPPPVPAPQSPANKQPSIGYGQTNP